MRSKRDGVRRPDFHSAPTAERGRADEHQGRERVAHRQSDAPAPSPSEMRSVAARAWLSGSMSSLLLQVGEGERSAAMARVPGLCRPQSPSCTSVVVAGNALGLGDLLVFRPPASAPCHASDSSPTSPRWISCHGVWCLGILVAATALQCGAPRVILLLGDEDVGRALVRFRCAPCPRLQNGEAAAGGGFRRCIKDRG